MSNKTTPLSVLDLVPIGEGFSIGEAMHNSANLAQEVEKFGFSRYWVAEHHNLIDIGSAATSVILSHIGAKTKSIRLGSGGIMLPNHAPFVIAEQFGTLESLYPNRIDLGLGRAPGTDMETAMALRRDINTNGHEFPQMLEELQYYFSTQSSQNRVKAIPGVGINIPIWLLGSSTFSAQLAAKKGLPFAFASHFAPDAMDAAIEIYRKNFQASKQLQNPYVIICVNAIAADTQKEAEFLATSEMQKFLNLGRGIKKLLSKPVKDMNTLWQSGEQERISRQLRESIWGNPEYVCERLNKLIEKTKADEIMINSWVHNPQARIYSYELIAKNWF